MNNLKQKIKNSIRQYLNENIDTTDIDDVFNYFMKKNLNYELQENLENAYDELKELIKNNTIKAYRLLNVDDINDININNLGRHFTTDKQNTTNEDFLEKIGVIDVYGYYNYEKFFVVEVETNINNINWYETFDNRINYYGEDEINFISDKDIKIISIEEIEI